MVEHSLCMRGARGSIPRISIYILKKILFYFSLFLIYKFTYIILFFALLFLFFILISKKRQRQGSNLRSQREIAQQATALTTRPRCLSYYYIFLLPPSFSSSIIYLYIFISEKKNLEKRQWQDLNLRIQRIIDFKSIALDHSATLS